jgi:hypothetical protein
MRLIALLAVGSLLALASGCGPGVVRSHDERVNVNMSSFEMDIRQMRDDWDALWMADREYRLTKWHIR